MSLLVYLKTRLIRFSLSPANRLTHFVHLKHQLASLFSGCVLQFYIRVVSCSRIIHKLVRSDILKVLVYCHMIELS
jgi:hypothetical protein